MSDTEENNIPMAECGSCRAIIPLDSKDCPECGVSFSGVSDEALGECGACQALVPLDSKSCPECGVYFVADDVLDVLRNWFNNTGIDAKMLFSKFDSDSDGSINAEELRDGLLKMNLADLPPSQIDRLITEVDTDGDGVISLDELVASINGEELSSSDDVESDVSVKSKDYSENVLERVMKKHEITDKDKFLIFAADFDENNNDYLTEAELKKAAKEYVDESTDSNLVEESSDDDEEESDDSSEVEDDANDVSEDMLSDGDVEEGDESDDVQIDNEDEVEDTSSEDYLRILVTAALEKDMTIRSMFESMDLDDDGLINGPELQKGIEEIAGENLSPSDILGIIALVDSDSDNRVNAFELIDIIESMDVDMKSDITQTPTELLIEYMDALDINAGSFFRKLDSNGDGKINQNELSKALSEHSNDDVDQDAIDSLMEMFDSDGDDSIDMIEFIETLESHGETEEDDRTSLSKPKEFPSKWQKRMISKKWKDIVWPLIHTGFVFFILLWVVNGTLAPFVDGNGGSVPLDTEFGQTTGSDGTLYVNGDSYPCDDKIQIDGCKNSLTPLAGEGGEISMPAGFYWDGVLFIILGTLGLVGGLLIQLIMVPAWRARVKAMRDNESEKEEVKDVVDESSEENDSDSDDSDSDENEDDDEETDDDYDEDEIDIGSHIGLVLEDEEVFGVIIEFDDEEGLVTIEEDGTGDLVTGYQDEMFLED
ncbi:MAG: EF-hand domain-containing protein [Candidatus Poseidoniaceae archaeon]|nr:EF-hand domain-containing protein [Candidatus Poseidoniaceae archaeon]